MEGQESAAAVPSSSSSPGVGQNRSPWAEPGPTGQGQAKSSLRACAGATESGTELSPNERLHALHTHACFLFGSVRLFSLGLFHMRSAFIFQPNQQAYFGVFCSCRKAAPSLLCMCDLSRQAVSGVT